MQSVDIPAIIGRGQTVPVVLHYQGTGGGPTDTITIPIPTNLQVGTPAVAGCTASGAVGSETLTCVVSTPGLGVSAATTVNLTGRVLGGGLNITATSGNTVSQSYTVIEAGDIQIQKTSSSANVVNGASFTFTLTPSVAVGGDPVATGAVIRITDTLPGSSAQYQLTAISAAGYSCNSVAAAQASRSLVCDFTGNGSAAMGTIVLTGRTTLPGTGNLTNNVNIATTDNKYIDLVINNNTAAASVAVTSGTDPEPFGAFSATTITNTAQNFTLTYQDNGPQATTGAVVRVAIPAGFTIGVLPGACSNSGAGTVNGIAGTVISCTSGVVASGGTQNFVIPLTTPGSPGSGNFGVDVVTSGAPPLLPDGAQDYAPGNNTKLVPYNVVAPSSDLSLSKSKSSGPIAAGANISNSITVTNNGLADAVYTAAGGAQPLRVVDDMTMNEEYVSASAGWTCNAFDDTPAVGTRRVICQQTLAGTLTHGGGTLNLTLTTRVKAGIATPLTLSNTACTGATALTNLGLTGTDGPQPADSAAGNDCATASVVGTPVVGVPVSILKESSRDGTTWVDSPTVGVPTLGSSDDTVYWRLTIQNSSGTQTIPTLNVADTLPAILNLSKTAPVPSAITPAYTPLTSVTAGSATGSCPAMGAGSSALNCSFTNVAPNTTIVVTIPVVRPLAAAASAFTNTATLSSPDATLTGSPISDAAAINIVGRSDWVMTAMSANLATPKVGQDVTFTAVAANYGPNANTQPVSITSHLDPAKYQLQNATAAGMSCSINNPAAGDVTCTENAASSDPYVTRTVNFTARVLKPGSLPLSGPVYTNETVTALVTMNAADCEWRVETTTAGGSPSTACNDGASKATSNNSKATVFDVAVPQVDLIQRKLQVYPGAQTSFGFGDTLSYRLRIQNAGPSRAEGVKTIDRLNLPAGVTATGVAVSSINGASADAGYTLDATKSGSVSCSVVAGVPAVPTPDSTLPGAAGDVICVLDSTPANSFLPVNQEVNFLLSFTLNNTLSTKYVAANRAAACADESTNYETNGKCSFETSGANNAGNNIATVSDVVFPKTDLGIAKTRITANPLDIGQPARYDLAIKNNGPQDTTQIRVTDQLPPNFEWVTGSVKVDATTTTNTTPSAAASGVGAGTVTAVNCTASPASLVTVGSSQTISCILDGTFPGNAVPTYTLTLWAKPKQGFFTGPYLADQTNTATVSPGKDSGGNDLSIDTNPANNSATALTQVTRSKLGGRSFLDLNNNGDQNGSTALTDQGLGGITITLTGNDRFGFPVSRTTTTDNAALGVGSTRGDYLFDDLPPSDTTGYTITQTQPAAYGNGTPQPNTARAVRNGTSTATTGSYGVSNTAGTSVISGVQLGSSGNGVQFDFPELQKPWLTGYVYLDADNNGVKGGGDSGINGVTMTLIGCRAGPNGLVDTAGPIGAGPVTCSGDDVAVNMTTTTYADGTYGAGYYRFVLDEPGRYSVIEQVTQPSFGGYVTARGQTTAGSVDLLTSAPGSNDGGTRGSVNTTGSNAGGNPGVVQEITGAVAASQIRDIVINNSAALSVNNNFGEIVGAQISGVVYTERGVLNSNYAAGVDWPLPGANVTLTGTDDLGQAVTRTLTTDASGAYLFDGLRPGAYQVVKTNPAGIVDEVGGAFPGKDAGNVTRGTRVNDDTINAIVLAAGAAVTNTNFAVTNGVAPEATIAAYIYVDRNRNHSPDPGENKRLEGETVNLVQGANCESGTIIATAKSDMYGSVYFKGEVGKNYLICEVQPIGYENGNANGVPGSNSIAVTNLQTGGSYGNSFGEWGASIAGSVYEDFGVSAALSNNGVRDAGEKGIAGVPVTLSGRDIRGQSVNLNTVTDTNGNYIFDDLMEPDAAGYIVVEGNIPPAAGSYSDGKDKAGNASVAPGDAKTVNDQTSGIRIAAGERATGYDFGELKGGSISGTVFLDNNGNGKQDGADVGIPGVTVTLTGTDSTGAAINRSVVTDASGNYRFDNVPAAGPAGYTVTEQLAQPYAPGTQTLTSNGTTTAGTIDGTTSGNATPVATVPSAVSGIMLPNGGNSVQNNFAEVLVSAPDLVVTKTANKAIFTEGNTAIYTLRVKNIGQQPTAGSYTVVDKLSVSTTPAKWNIDSATGSGWTCSISSDKQQVSCDSSKVLAAGEENSAPIALGVSIANGATAFGPMRNVVSVSGGGEPADKKPQPGELASPPNCGAQPEFNVCQLSTPLQLAVGLDGHVWIDGSNKKVLDPTDKLLPSWIVEVYQVNPGQSFTDLVRGGKPIATTTTDAQGHYQVCGLEPGTQYRVLFRDPANRIAFPGVVTNESGRVTGSDYWSKVTTGEGFEYLQVTLPQAPAGASSSACNVTAPEQSLPLDPNGVVYDSKTRLPIPGATVTLVPEGSCPGYDPKLYIINYETYGKDAAGNPVMTTGADGFYKFLLSGDPAGPKSCTFRFVVKEPAGYKPPPSTIIAPKPPLATPAAPGIYNVQPQKPAPTGNQDTTYYFVVNLGLNNQEVFNNHIPLDPSVPGSLAISKTGDKRVVQVGDTVLYTITVQQTKGDSSGQVTVRDRLPAGFTLVPGTVRVNGVAAPNPQGGVGPLLAFNLGALKTGQQLVLTYRVRVGVGAQQGDGINSATAHSCNLAASCVNATTLQPDGSATTSNEGRYQVQVSGGVFTDSACVLGKVFVDCNNNHVQDSEELGIPGVRLYFEDGVYAITDSEGKYNRCNLTPRSHVLKVDAATLPRGARLTTSSNRNLGDAGSLWLDIKNGELHRADFVEGSCSNPVIEQVKARRAQGEVRSVETEQPGGPPLQFESKPATAPQQATDGADQAIVKPRYPVDGASATTTGANHAR